MYWNIILKIINTQRDVFDRKSFISLQNKLLVSNLLSLKEPLNMYLHHNSNVRQVRS